MSSCCWPGMFSSGFGLARLHGQFLNTPGSKSESMLCSTKSLVARWRICDNLFIRWQAFFVCLEEAPHCLGADQGLVPCMVPRLFRDVDEPKATLVFLLLRTSTTSPLLRQKSWGSRFFSRSDELYVKSLVCSKPIVTTYSRWSSPSHILTASLTNDFGSDHLETSIDPRNQWTATASR